MTILHLSDLHFGKSLHGVSFTDSGDQKYWVDRTLEVIREKRPDAVVIAGDVYDRGVPSREAVSLLDEFLTKIAKEEKIPVLLTAGNHDGGERLQFASRLLKDSLVHIAGTVEKEMVCVTLNDEFGPVNFYLMPFVFPAAVRNALGVDDTEISSYTEAVDKLLKAQETDFTQRNVLVAHQTVLNGGNEPEHSESETAVGGVGGIDSSVLQEFDYVALGHIHGAQKVGCGKIRYAGAPLCYHFSEAEQQKGLLFVTVGEKGRDLKFETVEVEPLHRVRPTMTGTLEELLELERKSTAKNEYVRVELTDDPVPPDAREKMSAVLEANGCILLDITAHRRAPKRDVNDAASTEEELDPAGYFTMFYEEQRSSEMSPEDAVLIALLSDQVTEMPDKTEEELTELLVKMAVEQEEKR